MTLRVLDLFSGIGGFSLGLERTGGFRTVAFCEIDPYCRAVLRKHWPDVPCFSDVRDLHGYDTGPVDVICGGYPCQPFSVAGKRAGTSDNRHLWPEYRRLVEELRPAWVIGENVNGHVSMGLDDVLSDLDGLGYQSRPFVIPAVALDAKHRRDRVWIVAHAERNGTGDGGGRGAVCDRHWHGTEEERGRDELESWAGAHGQAVADAKRMRELQPQGIERHERGWFSDSGEVVAYAISERGCSGHAEREDAADAGQSPGHPRSRSWDVEPDVGRVANGVPSRVDRLRALGNAVVPQIPEIIGRAILKCAR